MNKEEYRYYRSWLINDFDGQRKLIKILLKRKEKKLPLCSDCGACCVSCFAYDFDNRKCSIWKDACGIFHCDMYPLCPEALEKDNLVGVCRYYWD